MVELKEVISGTDPQAQIAAYESMIDAGAQGIISFPISATALNRTVKRGCSKGVKFFMYDATVTEPCAYNVSYISAGFGENTAQALVNELGGKGKSLPQPRRAWKFGRQASHRRGDVGVQEVSRHPGRRRILLVLG